MQRFNYRPLERTYSDSEINVRGSSTSQTSPCPSKTKVSNFAEGDCAKLTPFGPFSRVMRIRDEINIDLRLRTDPHFSESDESIKSLNRDLYPIEEVTEDSDRSASQLNARQLEEQKKIQNIRAESLRCATQRPTSGKSKLAGMLASKLREVIEIHKANVVQPSEISLLESEFSDSKQRVNEVNSSMECLIEDKSQQMSRLSSLQASSSHAQLSDDYSFLRTSSSAAVGCCCSTSSCFGKVFKRKWKKP
jgi:hypothetical protein